MQSTENGNGDHAAGPLDGPPQWRILSQSQVRSRLIVIVRIDGKNPSQVRLAKDNDFIEAFAAECANQTRGMTILPGERGVIGRSRMPIALTRVVKTHP